MINLLLDEAYIEEKRIRFNSNGKQSPDFESVQLQYILEGDHTDTFRNFIYKGELIDSIDKIIPVFNDHLEELEGKYFEEIFTLMQNMRMTGLSIIDFRSFRFDQKCDELGLAGYATDRNLNDLSNYYRFLDIFFHFQSGK